MLGEFGAGEPEAVAVWSVEVKKVVVVTASVMEVAGSVVEATESVEGSVVKG